MSRGTYRQVRVVDVANVVGSRPDGWWRDRVGATERLLRRLGAATRDGTPVVAVLEGEARGAGDVEGVRVVRAPGSGDDALVAVVAELLVEHDPGDVVVVTADRGLLGRLPPGVRTLPPGELLRRLDPPQEPPVAP